ncbi:MAG: lipid II flippase MurJ [Patescibacteria group bacterium]
MVTRLLSLLYKEWSGLHQAAFLLGMSSLAAQVLALLRDRLLASTFGASTELDIYYSAFRIPDLIYVTFASVVSVTVLIPFILKKKEEGGEEKVRRFLSGVSTVFVGTTCLMGLFFFITMPYFSGLIAPGFTPEAKQELILLSRILLLSPLLLGLSNFLGGITQSYRKFFAYILSPVLYNLGIIVGIVFFYPTMGLVGLVWGVIVGAVLHMLIQLPSVYRLGLLPSFTVHINFKEIKEVVFMSLPRTLTLATHQISLAVLVALGSLMAVGSITVFNLAFNLQSVPLIIIGVSYSVAAFPTLAALFSRGETKKFVGKIETAIRHIFFWSLPAMVLFIVLRAQIVRVILGAGNFSWSDTRLVAAGLAVFVVSVVAQSFVQLFVRVYYASGRTKVPLLANIISSIGVIILAFILIYFFKNVLVFRYFIELLLRVDNVPGTIILTLPLAYSLGLTLNAIIYWWVFRRDFGAFSPLVYQSAFRSFSAAVVAGFVTYHSLLLLAPYVDQETYVGIFLQGLGAGVSGIMSAILIFFILKSVELAEFTNALSARVWREPIRVEEEEI